MTDEEQELLEQYLIYERQVQKPTSQWSPASTTSSAWTAPCPSWRTTTASRLGGPASASAGRDPVGIERKEASR